MPPHGFLTKPGTVTGAPGHAYHAAQFGTAARGRLGRSGTGCLAPNGSSLNGEKKRLLGPFNAVDAVNYTAFFRPRQSVFDSKRMKDV